LFRLPVRLEIANGDSRMHRVPQVEMPGELSSPLGRYSIHQAISVGEITSVHIGLVEGAEGFRKTVAIKRLIAGLVHEQGALAELTYEACVGALIHHPNVVSVLDLGQVENGPFLVMEYVLGDSVAGLLRASGRCPVPVAVAIVADVLRGLHAAHIAEDAAGAPLEIVHRAVSPENILVGVDGMARVIDFGSSVSALDSMTIPNRQRWTRRATATSPEQLMGWPVDGRADIFAAAVVLWELVAGMRPFRNHGAHQAFLSRPTRNIPPASAFNMEVSPEFEAVMERALSWSPRRRFETAIQFAEELEAAVAPSTRAEVATWVETRAATRLAVQRKLLNAMDAPYGRISAPPPSARRSEPSYSSVGHDGTNALPARRGAGLALRLSGMRSAIADAFRRAPWAKAKRPRGGASSWFERARQALAQNASTVLAGLSLLCLLLAATRASLASRARAQRIAPPPPVPVLQAAAVHLEDECPPVATSLAPLLATPLEMNARPATLIPGAPPEPARREPSAAEERPLVKTPDPRERTRSRVPIRRAPPVERASCDPPFMIDDAGIRRIKPSCL
jgi:serine/threonine-protein kinase